MTAKKPAAPRTRVKLTGTATVVRHDFTERPAEVVPATPLDPLPVPQPLDYDLVRAQAQDQGTYNSEYVPPLGMDAMRTPEVSLVHALVALAVAIVLLAVLYTLVT